MAALTESAKYCPESLVQYRDTISPQFQGKHIFEACTSIGLRPSQEDRFVMIPSFFKPECSFCGVFDGTVGDDASEYINQNIVKHLCENLNIHPNSNGDNIFDKLEAKQGTAAVPIAKSGIPDDMAEKLREAMHKTFVSSDKALIEMCAEHSLHYASSTGVTAFLWKNLLTVAHIGDSRACIARLDGENIQPEWLTVDHKANMPLELQRIEANGGSLAWLHGNKPYIRGGDFFQRQALGQHPKQLNYSRAFGGKDLKMYGLSAEPDISHFEIAPEDRLVLIGSDGLWDVLNPRLACEIAFRARAQNRSATTDIVQAVINEMPICGVRDNITVIAIFLNANN